MQHFLRHLKYNIKIIIRHHMYNDMTELLDHAKEAKTHFAKEAQFKDHSIRHFSSRSAPFSPSSTSHPNEHPSTSTKPTSSVSNIRKPAPTSSGTGSNMSTMGNRDMECHTCGGKGHFKRDYP